MFFKILHGRHAQGRADGPKDKHGEPLKNERGKEIRGAQKIYAAKVEGKQPDGTISDIVESDVDLVAKFGEKFQRLDRHPSRKVKVEEESFDDIDDEEEVDLEAMRIGELRKFAEDREISLEGVVNTKKAIAERIKEAMENDADDAD